MEGKTFQHFKGGIYDVIVIAKDSDTLEDVVVYKSRADGKVWTRNKAEFEGMHETGVKRFTEIPQEDTPATDVVDETHNLAIIDGLWDVLVELVEFDGEITEDLIYRNFKRLPKHIVNIGHSWGWNDTVFRDDAYVWFKEQGVL